MARLRSHIIPWGNKYDGPNNYKDGRRGAVEDAFWDEDEEVFFPKPSARKKPTKKKGCPGNNLGPHVYVWVPWDWRWDTHIREYEIKVCCGCEKRASGRKSWRRKI